MRSARLARRFVLTVSPLVALFATSFVSPEATSAAVAPMLAPGGLATSIDAKSANWPQLGFDSGHSGYNPNEKTLSPQNVANLTLLWSTATDNAAEGLVAENGVLYGESGDLLYAMNAATGNIVWSVGGINTAAKAPAVAGAVVLASCSTQSQGSGLCGYKAKNGSLVWADLANCFACGLISTPTVDGKLTYVEYGTGSTEDEAIAAKTGKLSWYTSIGNHCPGNGTSNADPVGGGSAYYTLGCLGSDNHTSICAFNAQNGTPGWCTALTGSGSCGSAHTNGVTEAQGALFANVVYSSGCAEQIVALNAKTGSQEWAVTIPGNNPLGPTQPSVANGVVFDLVGQNTLEAFSAKNGSVLWTQTAVAQYGQGVSIANGVVYTLCSGQAGLCALSAASGQVLWVSGTGAGADVSATTPVILNGVVYASCGTANFCAFALPQRRSR